MGGRAGSQQKTLALSLSYLRFSQWYALNSTVSVNVDMIVPHARTHLNRKLGLATYELKIKIKTSNTMSPGVLKV